MKIQRILHPFRGKNSNNHNHSSKGNGVAAAVGTADLTGAREGASLNGAGGNNNNNKNNSSNNGGAAEDHRTRAASPMEDSVPYDYHYPADFYDDDDVAYDIHNNDINNIQSRHSNDQQVIQHNQKVFGEVESYFSSTTTTASQEHNDGASSAASSSAAPPPRGAVRPPRQTFNTNNNRNNNNNNNSPRKNNQTTKATSTSSPPKITTVHVPAPSQQQQQQPYSDRSAQTRHLVKQFIADIWNRGELDLIPTVCSPSLRFNGNTGFDRVGHDGLARMVTHLRDCLAEYHCEIHSMVVEDNKCFCRLRFTGKHVGPLLGYPPTQQSVAWMGASEYTIQNDKILKVWELGDVKSLEEQLQGRPTGQRSTSIAKHVD